jgi:hypothetical protein
MAGATPECGNPGHKLTSHIPVTELNKTWLDLMLTLLKFTGKVQALNRRIA